MRSTTKKIRLYITLRIVKIKKEVEIIMSKYETAAMREFLYYIKEAIELKRKFPVR